VYRKVTAVLLDWRLRKGRAGALGTAALVGVLRAPPALLLTTSYEPHINGMILAMREGRYLSTARPFSLISGRCAVLLAGDLLRGKKVMLPIRSQDEADGRMSLSK
jgi:hypothetical protein